MVWECFVYMFLKMLKKSASLASICNKFHWLITSVTKDFLKTCSLHFGMEKSLVLCVLYLEKDAPEYLKKFVLDSQEQDYYEFKTL